MESNLIGVLRSAISPDLTSSISSVLGESEQGVSKAIDAAIPVVLKTISDRASTDKDFVRTLISQATASGVVDNITGLFKGDTGLLGKGSGMITSLLGNKSGVVSSVISSYANVKPSSVSTILSCITPLALGMIGRQTRDMDAGQIQAWLRSQDTAIHDSIPAGLNVNSLISSNVHEPAPLAEPEKKTEGMPVWALPMLMMVTGAMLIWYFIGKVKTEKTEPEVVSTTKAAPEAPPQKQALKVELPNGVVLDAYQGGIEDQLVRFLKDSTTVAGKDTWFDFDNLNFAVGTAEISPESQVQINNIAAILKAFPKVKIKIGGYTDKTGDESANMTLSENRAEAVKAALVAAGVGGQVTDAEGYGSQFAKVPAEAPESSRLSDRRVSVSVREK
jgi:outer membrane protein OmpA-like peptidoglycan-associated protein